MTGRDLDPALKRLLGSEGKHGEALGLTDDWAYRIIKQVGNYGEAFERKGHHYAVLDGVMLAQDGEELARLRHTTIFHVRKG